MKMKKKSKNKKIIVYLTFFYYLGLLSFLFFSNNEQINFVNIWQSLKWILKIKNIPNDVDTLPLIELIINIIPSINIFSF